MECGEGRAARGGEFTSFTIVTDIAVYCNLSIQPTLLVFVCVVTCILHFFSAFICIIICVVQLDALPQGNILYCILYKGFACSILHSLQIIFTIILSFR